MILQFNNFIFLKKVSTSNGLLSLKEFNLAMQEFLNGITQSPIPIEGDFLSDRVKVLSDTIDKNQFYKTYLEPFFFQNKQSTKLFCFNSCTRGLKGSRSATDQVEATLYSSGEVQNSNYLVHPQAVTFTEKTTAQAIAIAHSNIPSRKSMDIFALNFANEYKCGGGTTFTKESVNRNKLRAWAQEENLVAEKIDGFFQSMHNYTDENLRYKEEYRGFSNKGNTFISQNLILRAIDNVGTNRDKPNYNLSTHSSCLLSEEGEGIKFTLFTSAAPNLKPRNHSIQGKPPRQLKNRIQDHLNAMNFQLSQTKSDSAHIILGAFGCGAFCNDPSEVARDYFDTLRKFKWYKPVTIEFAVPNIIKKPPSSDDPNVVEFRTMVQNFNALN